METFVYYEILATYSTISEYLKYENGVLGKFVEHVFSMFKS